MPRETWMAPAALPLCSTSGASRTSTIMAFPWASMSFASAGVMRGTAALAACSRSLTVIAMSSSLIVSPAAEFVRQGLGVAREQSDVAADGDEEESPVDDAPRLLFPEAQEPWRLAGGADALPGVEDRRLDLGMLRIGEMAHIGGKVGRADEDAVDAVDGGDGGDIGDGAPRLTLHEDADLARSTLGVIGDAAIAVGARRAGKAADAVGRIARRRDGA